MLADHDEKKGSFGLVLNRPTGKLVGDLLDEKPLGHLSRVPVLRLFGERKVRLSKKKNSASPHSNCVTQLGLSITP